MNPDIEKLRRESKFIEESFSSGIITKEEYEAAKARVQESIAKEEVKEEKITEEQEKKEDKSTVHEPPAKNDLRKFYWISAIAIVVILLLVLLPHDKNEEAILNQPIPECATYLDCQKDGFVGTCLNASCGYVEAKEVNVTIVNFACCELCDSGRMQNTLKQIYPGAVFRLVDKDSEEGKKLISDYDIGALPAYIMGNEVESDSRFSSTKSAFEKSDDGYLMKPSASGSAYFLDAREMPGRIDIFLTLNSAPSMQAWESLIEFAGKKKVTAFPRYYVKGSPDEETMRQICIREESYSKLMAYSACIQDSDFSECLSSYGINEENIDDCMDNEAESLRSEEMRTASEFYINTAPVFVFNNKYKKGGALSADNIEELFCLVNEC